jgi:hypothetical protein
MTKPIPATELIFETFLIIRATQWRGMLTNTFNRARHRLCTLIVTGALYVLIPHGTIGHNETPRKKCSHQGKDKNRKLLLHLFTDKPE